MNKNSIKLRWLPFRRPEGSIPMSCLSPPLCSVALSSLFDGKKKVRWHEQTDLKGRTNKRCSPWLTRARRINHAVAAIGGVVRSNHFHLAAVSFVWLKWIIRQKYTETCDYWFLGNWKEAQCIFMARLNLFTWLTISANAVIRLVEINSKTKAGPHMWPLVSK